MTRRRRRAIAEAELQCTNRHEATGQRCTKLRNHEGYHTAIDLSVGRWGISWP